MRYACPKCGRTHDRKGRCDNCQRDPNAPWSKDRDRGVQARFRRAVLERDGHRCMAVVNGHRCPATTKLQAHHTIPGVDRVDTGITLCAYHHREVDPHAR